MSEESHSRRYGAIFLGLFVLTILELATANLPLARLPIALMLVGLAIVKASLVAMFYMHLKFEKILLTLVALAPLAFSLIFTLIIGHDLMLSR